MQSCHSERSEESMKGRSVVLTGFQDWLQGSTGSGVLFLIASDQQDDSPAAPFFILHFSFFIGRPAHQTESQNRADRPDADLSF